MNQDERTLRCGNWSLAEFRVKMLAYGVNAEASAPGDVKDLIQCETPLFGRLWSVMLSLLLPRVKSVRK